MIVCVLTSEWWTDPGRGATTIAQPHLCAHATYLYKPTHISTSLKPQRIFLLHPIGYSMFCGNLSVCLAVKNVHPFLQQNSIFFHLIPDVRLPSPCAWSKFDSRSCLTVRHLFAAFQTFIRVSLLRKRKHGRKRKKEGNVAVARAVKVESTGELCAASRQSTPYSREAQLPKRKPPQNRTPRPPPLP